MREPIERLIEDMSSFLSSRLNSLGLHKYGLEKDDLLQEIRIRIWKACDGKEDNIQYLNAYVKKIVYSVFVNAINTVKKDNRVLETARFNASNHESLSGNGRDSCEMLKKILLVELAGLKEYKQMVIRLRLEGFTIGEIAKLNKWSYRKTCNIFYRGINELKHKMREEGYFYED